MVAIALGYSLFWYIAVTRVQEALEQWASDRRGDGWNVSFDQPIIAGYPFNFDIRLKNASFAASGNRWSWVSDKLYASARPWSPGKVTVRAPGVHRMKISDHEKLLRLDDATAKLDISSGTVKYGVFKFSGIRLTSSSAYSLTATSLNFKIRSDVAIRKKTEAPLKGVELDFEIRDLVLPFAWSVPLANNVSRASVNVVVTGEMSSSKKLTEALPIWRESGGLAEVRSFFLNWPPLSVQANGTFAIDEYLQPQGAMSTEIAGAEPTVDALIKANVINAKTAFAVKFANRVFSKNGSKVRLPLSIQKSRVYIGPVPVLRLRPVEWK